MARRDTFIRRFSGLGRLLPFPFLLRLCGQRFIVLLYHAVTDEAPAHIRHLYRLKTPAEFTADLDFLLRHLRPVDVLALRDHVTGVRRLEKPGFLVTFDDGLREFGEVAAPILREKGVPAICFLNSDFVGNRGLFYRYKAGLLMDHLQGMEDEAVVRAWREHYRVGAGSLRETLLRVGYGEAGRLDELATATGLDFAAYLRQQRPYLDPDEVRGLLDKGFHFGAHSLDHPEYRFLDLDEQLRQTRASQDAVQAGFGVGERWFAFPFTDFGVSRTFFDTLYADAPGPELTFGCAGLKRDVHPRHVQRIPMEMNGLSAREILPGELLYYLAKAPFGKNKIRRP